MSDFYSPTGSEGPHGNSFWLNLAGDCLVILAAILISVAIYMVVTWQ